jgi:hypothetical protein
MKHAAIIALGLAVGTAATLAQTGSTGNGSQPGSHYNLNILGKRDCTPADLNPNSGHTIQVFLSGGQNAADINGTLALTLDRQNKIFLQPGNVFQVINGNACDGALFMLPTNSCYNIYARALGTPGGYANMTTCAIDNNGTPNDPTDDVVVCSMFSVNLNRTRGSQKFTNVTKQLTTITFTLNGVTSTVNLFDPALYSYFWNYDNHGLRLAQLRFYPVGCQAPLVYSGPPNPGPTQ